MPSIVCKCKQKLSYGEIPNPIEWLMISDVDYDRHEGIIDSEKLYMEMQNILKCDKCGRLWIFWGGFHSVPTSYLPEL